MVNGIGAGKARHSGSEPKLCSLLQLEISPERIHFLKFILEGYDGLAILSTVDAGQGIVELRYPPEAENDLKELLQNIESQIIKHPNRDHMP